MRIRLALAVALLGLAAASPRPASAQMPEVPPGKWWTRPRVVQILGLTGDQQDRLEQIFAKNRRAFVDLKAEVERRQIDLDETMAKKDPDQKRLAESVDAMEQARMKLARHRTMMFVEMKGVLTAEQWSRIQERREEWRAEKLEERRQLRRDGGPRRKVPKAPDAP